ncbi:MAG: DNA translocase FtsK 4TM domain-containing protein, partial [Actinomycetota bacterium]
MATKTKRRASAKKKRAASSKRTPVRQHLAPWARDAIGIGLVVFALIAVLGVWFDAAGVVGHGINVALHAAVGSAAVTFPVIALYWGVLMLRDSIAGQRVRMFIGFAIAVVGILAIVSLARENPRPFAGYHDVRHAGGVIGALLAWPLSKALSEIGAAIVSAGLAVLGLLIFTGTPLSSAWSWLSERLQDLRAAHEAAHDAEEARGEDHEPIFGRRRDRTETAPSMPVIDVSDHAEPDLLVEELEDDEEDDVDGVHVPLAPKTAPGAYALPPVDLLRTAPPAAGNSLDEEHTMEALERTFHTFGVPAHVVAAHRGPTVTMYEVEVEAGTKVNKVLNLAEDIAYALATPDVRIIAPIPGRSAIGVEVPNRVRDFVMLGDVLRAASKDDRYPLSVALGKDVHGRAQMVNLTKMPHLLIAGATGAGKSSLINCFITSILMRTTPDEVKLVLVDPKRVELSHFADLPHLLSPVIVHPKRAAEALGWVVREMEQRYELLAMCGVRDIDGYRAGLSEGTLRIPPGQEEKFTDLPYILVVIDELADLMMVAPRDVEDAICRIAQMARAVGIHLVVATQRPSVDVVTGLIKANIPSRIALMTSSQADSRVILDMNGAEKLVGHGDMLFAPSSASKPARLQAAWVTEKEIEQISEWIRSQREPQYDAHVEGLGRPPVEGEDRDGGLGGDDELLEQAADLVIRSQLGSTSMLQRKLKVGFARAGRLMDLLEERGIVGPSLGSKARDVLITPEEWAES